MSQAVAIRRNSTRGSAPRAVVMPTKPRAAKLTASSAPLATHRFLMDDVSIGIPGWVVDHASFRRWVHSPEGGVYLSDGVLISHLGAQVSNNPDGTYIANERFTDETVRLIEGAEQGVTEIERSPDMVLEVVSNSSVRKDYELLREAYRKANIREYWLVDARSDKLEYLILKHTSKGYTPVRKSAVFGTSLRLTAIKNQLRQRDSDLQVR